MATCVAALKFCVALTAIKSNHMMEGICVVYTNVSFLSKGKLISSQSGNQWNCTSMK